MIESGPAADLAALARVRDAMKDADNRADAAAFVAVLAEDVVIMAPGLPLLLGLDPCAAFVTEVLASYPQRRVGETIDEVHVSGDLAFDRGTFETEVFDAELGRHVRECGTALRIYRRDASGWKMARVMWHVDEGDEETAHDSPPA